MPHDIRKVVIPAAGLGTRLLPWTKAAPKEIIPVGGKPLIHYAIEEAVHAGIRDVIIVTNPGRTAAVDYFRRDPALEQFLDTHGKRAEADCLRALSSLANISVIYQEEQLGLANAVICARQAVAGEPFALLLPDALIVSARPCLRQLLDWYERRPAAYVAVRTVAIQEIHRFGVIAPAEPPSSSPFRVQSLIEKPRPDDAPSRYGVFGRYLLTPEIFAAIERVRPDSNGECQLTDALRVYAETSPLYAAQFEGTHYDIGNKIEYVLAVLDCALADPETSAAVREALLHLRNAGS